MAVFIYKSPLFHKMCSFLSLNRDFESEMIVCGGVKASFDIFDFAFSLPLLCTSSCLNKDAYNSNKHLLTATENIDRNDESSSDKHRAEPCFSLFYPVHMCTTAGNTLLLRFSSLSFFLLKSNKTKPEL